MSPNANGPSDSSQSSPPDLPDDLGERLSRLDESDLRAVISHAKSLLSPTPTVAELLEERPGEEILDVEERKGYTKVVKRQSCPEGCEECPHGPYLYHVRVQPAPNDSGSASLDWDFLGPVR